MNEDEAELLLTDRIEIIKTLINQYGEDKFYISFSGGKDSTALSYLIDLALPNNKIPRVFINTGIEYVAIVNFVKEMQLKDTRVHIIQPTKSLKSVLDEKGCPFKSKEHSKLLSLYQHHSRNSEWLKNYLSDDKRATKRQCPKILKYQFTNKFNMKVSGACCNELKHKPVIIWERENNKSIVITGMKNAEGGQRANIKGCVIKDKDNNVIKFHPFMKVTEEWENWFIAKYNIQLCELYYPPYNFKRTGCKGCPFALDLEKQLETMNRLMPNEARQCEMIWKPVYDEYRRIGFRLHKTVQTKLF